MAEIISTVEQISSKIDIFKERDKEFIVIEFYQIEQKNQWVLVFQYNGNTNHIDFYFKKKNVVRILPRKKSVENSEKFIEFLQENSFDASEKSSTITIKKVNVDFIEKFIEYISNKSNIDIRYQKNNNHYKFESSLGDVLHINKYDTGKVVIQTKPFFIYSVLMDYLSESDIVSENDIVEWTKITLNIIEVKDRTDELKSKLGSYFDIMPEAVKKTMKSSYFLCFSNVKVEDHSVLLAGIFRGLEAFLKDVLVNKFGYVLTKKDTFSMFHSSNDNFIGRNSNIFDELKKEVICLHQLYNSKRNVYLHVPINTETTPIIEDSRDAQSIVDEILLQINKTYSIIE